MRRTRGRSLPSPRDVANRRAVAADATGCEGGVVGRAAASSARWALSRGPIPARGFHASGANPAFRDAIGGTPLCDDGGPTDGAGDRAEDCPVSVKLLVSFRSEVRDSYIHDTANPNCRPLRRGRTRSIG